MGLRDKDVGSFHALKKKSREGDNLRQEKKMKNPRQLSKVLKNNGLSDSYEAVSKANSPNNTLVLERNSSKREKKKKDTAEPKNQEKLNQQKQDPRIKRLEKAKHRLNKETKELNTRMDEVQAENKKLKEATQKLKKEIASLKEEIKERDSNQSKEVLEKITSALNGEKTPQKNESKSERTAEPRKQNKKDATGKKEDAKKKTDGKEGEDSEIPNKLPEDMTVEKIFYCGRGEEPGSKL